MSKWHNLNEKEIKKVDPEDAGAYRISGVNKHGEPIKIRRFFGIDKEGIIDIGESKKLQKRLISFKRNTEKETSGHMAGWRFRFLDLHKNKKISFLKFSYKICNGKKAAEKEEHRLMAKYIKKHKELPPLNYKYNWSDE